MCELTSPDRWRDKLHPCFFYHLENGDEDGDRDLAETDMNRFINIQIQTFVLKDLPLVTHTANNLQTGYD